MLHTHTSPPPLRRTQFLDHYRVWAYLFVIVVSMTSTSTAIAQTEEPTGQQASIHADQGRPATQASAPQTPVPKQLTQALIHCSSATRPPLAPEAWQPIKLPHMWNQQDYRTGLTCWYKFEGQKFSAPAAIYLWRYSMNARIYVDDALLADGGQFSEPPTRNLHRPLMARLPESLNAKSSIYVHLRAVPGYGYLMPPVIGHLAPITQAYNNRYFYQITLSQILFTLTILISLACALLAFSGKDSNRYWYLFASSLSWSVFSLNPFIADVPVSTAFWLWLLHTSVDAFAVFLAMFGYQLTGHLQKYRPFLFGWLAVAGLTYLFLPLEIYSQLSSIIHAGSLLITMHLCFTLLKSASGTQATEARTLGWVVLFLLILGSIDLLSTTGNLAGWAELTMLTLNFGVPILFLALIAHLMLALRKQTSRLTAEVAAARSELEATYKSRAQLERDQAAALERERIYRDLHDDIGARLLNIVYSASSETQAEYARSTLQDLRALASASSLTERDLGEWSEELAAECRERCLNAEIHLHWSYHGQANSDQASQLHPEQTKIVPAMTIYHLSRIIRELVSNTIKHSGASTLNVEIKEVETKYIETRDVNAKRTDAADDTPHSALEIKVWDNGTAKSGPPGTGSNNIRRRVESLNATMQIEQAPHWAVSLFVPL